MKQPEAVACPLGRRGQRTRVVAGEGDVLESAPLILRRHAALRGRQPGVGEGLELKQPEAVACPLGRVLPRREP
ncbi:MAG: hypothetical protein OEY62_08800, partial [Acidimicrobiia bacterium]|nr:hypothetical protein [Acidimicrobiia bacterium]